MFELTSILEFLENNPGWITWTMFILVLVESLVLVGLFTPATLIVPGIGALAASVNIHWSEILAYATLGMIIGDSISFLIGKLIGSKVDDWIPEKYHQYLIQAKQFMKKYGILSVALGRFIGPLRCIIPLTAGSLGMRSKVFFPVEILASPFWTSAYVLTGYFLGIALVQYFTYVILGTVLIISIYAVYKDPMNLRK
ncbi:MAG: DedA family protein [Gammaproteobacteria bacterium]